MIVARHVCKIEINQVYKIHPDEIRTNGQKKSFDKSDKSTWATDPGGTISEYLGGLASSSILL